jgi:hypothetical protein
MTAFKQSYAVGAECEVTVEATSGDIAVSGWEQAEVVVQSSDGAPAVRQEGAMIHVVAPHSDDVVLRVPQRCELMLRTVSGDMNVQDVEGRLSAQTMSGDLEGRNVQGDLRVHTVSGDVTVRSARLTAASVDTVSGDVELETQLDAEGAYHVRSVSGDLDLLLPENQPCTVRSHSLSGDFTCRLPHEIKHQGWGKTEAQINGGGVLVDIHTTSGGTKVRAAGEFRRVEAPSRATAVPQTPPATHATRPLTEPPAPEPFGIAEKPPAPAEEPVPTAAQRMLVLKAIEEGKISVNEGLAKLRALE